MFLVRRQEAPETGSWTPLWAPLEFGEPEPRLYIRRKGLELGLNVQAIRFAGMTNDIFFDQHCVTIWFKAKHLAGEAKLTNEWSDAGWFDPKALPIPKFSPFQHLIRSGGYHFSNPANNSPANIVELCEPAEAFHGAFRHFHRFYRKHRKVLQAAADHHSDRMDGMLRILDDQWKHLRRAWRGGFTAEERGRVSRRQLRERWDE